MQVSEKKAPDLFDIRDDLDSAPVKGPDLRREYKDQCPKCGGSGFYRGPSSHGPHCFACNGKGYLVFLTSKEQREKAKAQRAARKASKEESNLAGFEDENPQFKDWWTDTDFGFAVSLREAVKHYGHLTDRQYEAAMRCINKRNEAKQASNARTAEAKAVNIEAIERAFAKGRANDIRRPKLRLVGGELSFVFSLAPENGSNAGAVYVKSEDTYIGKVKGGLFVRSRDCTPAQEQAVLQACADPLQAAVAYGRRFGSCSCCGRELTNHESIDLGIGPICREKFF